MNGKQFNDAIGLIDTDIVEEYIAEEARLAKRVKIRRSLSILARGAACICVLFLVSAAILITLVTGPSNGGNHDSAPGNEAPIPPEFTTVTTKDPPQTDFSPPEANRSYVFSFENEYYTVLTYTPILLEDGARDLGEVFLSENIFSEPTLSSRLFSLSSGSLAVEIDGKYYEAVKYQNK